MGGKYSLNDFKVLYSRLKSFVFGITAPTHDRRINYGFSFK